MPDKTSSESDSHAGSASDSPNTYSRDRLLLESQDFFGQPEHVVAGAFALMPTSKKNLTREEADTAIKKFLDYKIDHGPQAA